MRHMTKLGIVAIITLIGFTGISCTTEDPPSPTQINYPPPTSGTKAVTISLTTGSIPADGTSTVLITAVCTIDGKEAAGGLPVAISTDAGDFSTDGVDPINTSGQTHSVNLTTSSGLAQIYLISNAEPGTATIKAIFGNAGSIAYVDFVRTDSELAVLAMTVSPATGTAPLTASIVTTAKDDKGNVLSGVTVRYRVTDKTASFDREKVKTDSNGKASTFLRNVSKDCSITATASGISATELVTITNDKAESIKLSVLNTQGGLANQDPVLVNEQGQLLLRATVTGASGSVKGIDVTFRSTDGNTSFGGSNPVKTDSSGIAEIYANNIRDDSTITASAVGASDTLSVKINRKPVPVIRLISGEAKAGQVAVLTFSAESSYDPDQGYGDLIKTFTWARNLESSVDAPIANSNTTNPQLITFTIGEFGGILPADGDKLTVFLTVIDNLGLQRTAVYEVTFEP